MDNEYFFDIKEKISNAAFGKNRQCFLLIDKTLEPYQSDFSLYDLLKNYKSYPVTFHQRELHGALPLLFFPVNIINEKDCELFDKSIHHSLNEIKSEKLDSGEGRSVCAWISTELTGEQLAEQIALCAVQSVQAGGDILLRYFDPSVFGPLMSILDSWQKRLLLSNINTWSYIDGDGISQVENGDGECKKKLNYSLGITESNLSAIRRVVIVNKILREYRKKDIVNKLREREVTALLYPALDYFYSTFTSFDNDVVDFGLDVLSVQRLFYQDGVFDNHIISNGSKSLPSYSDAKAKIGSDQMKRELRT